MQSDFQKDLLSDKFLEMQKLERKLTWDKHQAKVDKMYNELIEKV